jgi:hypothetical protein
MQKDAFVLKNPLRLLGRQTEEILPVGGFGAVLARAGVGKTAFLIQIALDYLLRGKNVLHISLNDPVDKVCLWYEEVYRNVSAELDKNQTHGLWERALPHRFIMTFKAEGFSVPTLNERLGDLTEQGVFFPHVIMVDGFRFGDNTHEQLSALKTLLQIKELFGWFTMRTHRHKAPGPDGVPPPLHGFEEYFEVAIELKPVGSEVRIHPLKGGDYGPDGTELFLDPSTMLIKSK